jgi:hypothetical protein
MEVGIRLEAHGFESRKIVIRGLDPRIHHFNLVIPGCALLGADPESSTALRFWIPGSREDARPGMTRKWIAGSSPIKSGTGARQ